MDDLIDFLVEGNSGAISSATSGSTVFSAPLGSFDYNPFAQLQTTPPNYGSTMRTLPQEHTPTANSIPHDNFNQTNYPGMLSMYHPNSTPPSALGPQSMQPRSAEKSVHNNSTLLSSANGAGQSSTYQFQHHNSFSQPAAAQNAPTSFPFSHTAPPQTVSATAAPAQINRTTMAPMLIISDFSPAQDHQQGGGTKVLVCLANEIPEGFRQHPINVSILCIVAVIFVRQFA